MYDLIIIGGGVAGLNASLYAARNGLSFITIEKMFLGGQAASTYEIENYIGFEDKISGPELMMKMESHAKKFANNFIYEDVINIELDAPVKKVVTTNGEYLSKTIILAMGAKAKKLGLENEEALTGVGVSYCATCDGAFFKKREVAVVGGGDHALEDAIFLSRYCSRVYLIHRRNEFRATKVLIDAVNNNPNITVVLNSVIIKIKGEGQVGGLILQNVQTNEIKEIDANGLFVAIGVSPNSAIIQIKVKTTEKGYIITDENMATNISGVFAAGDIRQKPLRQIITAAADGAVAAYSATKFLFEQNL